MILSVLSPLGADPRAELHEFPHATGGVDHHDTVGDHVERGAIGVGVAPEEDDDGVDKEAGDRVCDPIDP